MKNLANNLPNCALYIKGNSLAIFDLELGNIELFSLLDSKVNDSLKGKKPLLCFAPDVLQKLKNNFNIKISSYFDILELHAFLFPTSFISPTLRGICSFYKLEYYNDPSKNVVNIFNAYGKMLAFIRQSKDSSIKAIAGYMLKDGWVFSALILKELKSDFKSNKDDLKYLEVWNNISKIENDFTAEKPSFNPLQDNTANDVLTSILSSLKYSKRKKQSNYLQQTVSLFQDFSQDKINTVLAQSETGTGKTIAYLANSIAFAKQNNFPIVFSTYTKVLQNQILKQMQKLADAGIIKHQDIVVRKGRENYVCLLNYKTILETNFKNSSITSGFLARWLLYTKDGDFKNGDFISWLKILINNNIIYSVTDQEGQCIGKSCSFYKRCYIENIKSKSLQAKYIIVNHATLLSNLEAFNKLSNIYIIDEAHHLLTTVDSVLSDVLSVRLLSYLQNWIFGSNDLISSNKAGLELRFKDILTENTIEKTNELKDTFKELLPSSNSASSLLTQVKSNNKTLFDSFFLEIYNYVNEINKESSSHYSLQAGVSFNISEDFKSLINSIVNKIDNIMLLITSLISSVENTKEELKALLETVYKDKNTKAKKNFENKVFKSGELLKGLSECLRVVLIWREIVKVSFVESEEREEDKKRYSLCGFVNKEGGIVKDIGLRRVFKDASVGLKQSLFVKRGKNVLLTSATLKSPLQNEGELVKKYGLDDSEYINNKHFFISSDFNYKKHSLVLILNDYNFKSTVLEKTLAIKELITASKGGALALFTSIARLKQSYNILTKLLAKSDINLLAQHVSKQELYSLMHMFKEDINSCLLGTDAIRDGIDIPGHSLRMLIYEKIPWQTKTILLRDRKQFFGKSYEDNIICSHINQAFGRLIRNETDRGIFVMLDKMFPSRYKVVFPQGVNVMHVSLAEATSLVKEFYK